jgi:hypothetical protein
MNVRPAFFGRWAFLFGKNKGYFLKIEIPQCRNAHYGDIGLEVCTIEMGREELEMGSVYKIVVNTYHKANVARDNLKGSRAYRGVNR